MSQSRPPGAVTRERNHLMSSLNARAAATALLLASVLIAAACGSASTPPATTAVDPSASTQPATAVPAADAPTQTSEPRDCQVLGYPCALSDVPPETRSRTAELARETARIVADGGSYADAADWLRGQPGVAESDSGDGTIRFRLDGGRPAWVLDAGDAVTSASGLTGQLAAVGLPTANSRRPIWLGQNRPPLFALRPEPTAGAVTLASVVSEGSEQKSATILAPFAWLGPSMQASRVADILSSARGYDDRVRYAENASIQSNDVTVETFLELADRSFVYLKSFGGSVCAAPDDCTSVVAVQGFDDPDRHLSDIGLASELDIITFVGVDWEAFGVGADFFRAHYPGGLKRAMVYFDAGALDDQTLTRAVKGPSSEYYFWDKRHGHDTLPVVAPYIERLATTGLAPGVVYEEMKDDLNLGVAKLIAVTPIGFGGQRVREIVTLRDDSGTDLVDGAGFAIDGHMDDGMPDKLHLVVGVDGITAEGAALTVVSLRVDGEDSESQVVVDGTDFGDGTWGLSFDVEVPDVHNGQAIALEATASLPEHGTSFHAVTVVAGIALGTQWEGHIIRESDVFFPGVKIRMDTDITFVRDQDAKAEDQRVKFFVGAGSTTWSIEGSYGGCSWSAGPVPLPLRALVPTDYIEFDLNRAEEGLITYYGEVSVVDGETVEGVKTCGGKSETFRTSAKGVVWLAPQDEEFQLGGTRIEDDWSRGSVLDSTYTWSFERTH